MTWPARVVPSPAETLRLCEPCSLTGPVTPRRSCPGAAPHGPPFSPWGPRLPQTSQGAHPPALLPLHSHQSRPRQATGGASTGHRRQCLAVPQDSVLSVPGPAGPLEGG